MRPVYLLDDSLSVEVFFEGCDREFGDAICVHIAESCPEDERVFRFEETNLYLTASQARALVNALQAALKEARNCPH